MNPEIYLLDEPSSNLDMTSIQELREHLLLVKGQGKTILIAEHRLYYLMDIADRIVYLDRERSKGSSHRKSSVGCPRHSGNRWGCGQRI